MTPFAGVRGILAGVSTPEPLEASVQRSSPAVSPWLSTRPCRHGPRRLRGAD